MSRRGSKGTPQIEDLRREEMLTPDEVAAMLGLRGLGWGAKRIAAEFGCSRNTVKRYLGLGGWARCRRPKRAKALDGLADWLAERFRRHRGNADVVRQELLAEQGIAVSLRTVERAVAPLRRDLAAEARATVRFDAMWGTDLTSTMTGEGQASIFVAVDHCSTECVGIHAARRATRFEALEPLRQGVRACFGAFAEGIAGSATTMAASLSPMTTSGSSPSSASRARRPSCASPRATAASNASSGPSRRTCCGCAGRGCSADSSGSRDRGRRRRQASPEPAGGP
jgi:hypothetical protein